MADNVDEEHGRQYSDKRVKPAFTMQLVFVTPEMASEWLERNRVNRQMTRSNVDKYAKLLRNGRFGTTHHGIAFNLRGELVDGQHRLKAIAETGIGVWLVVAKKMDVDRAIELPVDIGANRSRACMLEKNKSTVEIAGFIDKHLRGCTGDIYEIDAIHDKIEAAAVKLIEACGSHAATKSSASSRAAVVLQMMLRPKDATAIASQYRRYVLLEDVSEIWPSVMSLMRQVSRKTITATRQAELFARTFMAFDPDRKNLVKVVSKTESDILASARQSVATLMGTPKAGA